MDSFIDIPPVLPPSGVYSGSYWAYYINPPEASSFSLQFNPTNNVFSKKNPLECIMEVSHGTISGEGTDIPGAFQLSGTWKLSKLEIHKDDTEPPGVVWDFKIDKKYINQHKVTYSGKATVVQDEDLGQKVEWIATWSIGPGGQNGHGDAKFTSEYEFALPILDILDHIDEDDDSGSDYDAVGSESPTFTSKKD